MDVYLIRHTKTATGIGLCYGQSDVALAESFEQESQIIRSKLPQALSEAIVISSPLARCIRLAQTFDCPFSTDKRLQEINFGDWENQHFDEIDAEKLRYWTENFVDHSPPNGETFKELCWRVGNFWDELVDNKPAKQILLVTHAGVIRALFAHLLEMPPANAFKFKVDVGSVHKFMVQNNYTYLETLNR